MQNLATKPRIYLIIIAIIGALVMGYLVSLHYGSQSGGAFCNLGEGFSCDVVNKSEYSEILGIPLSVLGLLYFLGALGIALWKYDEKTLKVMMFASIAFLGPSLYLTGLEIFIIKSICVFCELSKVLILTIILISIYALRPQKLTQLAIAPAIILALILGGATFIIQSIDTGSNENYDEFAECLYDSGFRMYGSVTCSFCAKQRKLFGDSFEYIKEIECDPRNPNSETERCIVKNISHTPTWIVEDEEGNDITRFEPGVLSLEQLSEASSCPILGAENK